MEELRRRLNESLAPLARRVPLSPNSLTVLAFLGNCAGAGLLVAGAAERRLFLVAAGVITVAGLLDVADGIVARAQGKSTRFGDFLDHLLDRASDLLLVAGWCLGTGVRTSLALLTLVGVALIGYAGTQVEASFSRRSYEGAGRLHFVVALVAFPLLAGLFDLSRATAATLSIAEWLTVLIAAVAFAGVLQRILLARRLASESRAE